MEVVCFPRCEVVGVLVEVPGSGFRLLLAVRLLVLLLVRRLVLDFEIFFKFLEIQQLRLERRFSFFSVSLGPGLQDHLRVILSALFFRAEVRGMVSEMARVLFPELLLGVLLWEDGLALH